MESRNYRKGIIYKNRFYRELHIKNFNIHCVDSLYLRDAKSETAYLSSQSHNIFEASNSLEKMEVFFHLILSLPRDLECIYSDLINLFERTRWINNYLENYPCMSICAYSYKYCYLVFANSSFLCLWAPGTVRKFHT